MGLLEANGITDFGIKELVPPQVYSDYSEERILQFIDLRVVQAWQFIRTERGRSVFINTWSVKPHDDYPVFDGRGLRIGDGFQTSQHYYGRALDGDEYGTNESELYEWIMQDHIQKELVKIGVTTIEHIEHTPTWIHLDTRNWGFDQDKLQIVRPRI